MPVQRYSTTAFLLAALWTGDKAVLDHFPDFHDHPYEIDENNVLVLRLGDAAYPNDHYIVRGVTGYYFVRSLAQVADDYTLIIEEEMAFTIDNQSGKLIAAKVSELLDAA